MRTRREPPLGAFGTLELVGYEFSFDQREVAAHHSSTSRLASGTKRSRSRRSWTGLTGLANRRLRVLEQELARSAFRPALRAVLADIDDLRQSRFGHPTGDEVLKAFADLLQGSIREIDLAGRWGGEEFAVLLPETDLEGAAQSSPSGYGTHLPTRS